MRKFIPSVVLDIYYYTIEFFAALRYGFPGLRLKCIGITGTKGKSTTTYLITRILEEAGFKVASISSIEFRIHNTSEQNEIKMALPSRLTLQKFLYQALRNKVDYVVLECSSEGLAQHRVDFVHFIAAVFTNLAPEHIESHGSYEAYREAKAILFKMLRKGIAIINQDDPQSEYLSHLSHDRKKSVIVRLFGNKDMGKLRGIDIKLLGEFNQFNALAAYTTCESLGVKREIIKKALEKVAFIPGRLEEINEGQNFRVFVDYAHNPSSLEAVLKATKKLQATPKESKLPTGQASYKLILVTGSQGGGRDRWKRPEMGKIAAKYANVLIITNEDPYQENPQQIINDVYRGATNDQRLTTHDKKVLKILDRKEAIKKALQMAKKGDIVLIAGKGSETVMEAAKGKIAWNEREIVRKVLGELFGKSQITNSKSQTNSNN